MFHGKMDRCIESQGWTMAAAICPNVPGRAKGRIAQTKRPCAGSLDMSISHKWRELVSSGHFVFAATRLPFSGLTFVLFCFVFLLLLSLNPRPSVQSFCDMHTCAPTDTQLAN